MPTQSDWDAFKATLKTDVAEIVAAIEALKAKLTNGVAVTDADLTELNADLATLGGELPPTPPPVPPTP